MSIISTISSFLGVNKLAVFAVAGAFVAGGFLGWHEKALRIPALLEAQKAADVAACKTAQDKTKGENDALVIARNRIADDLARARRLRPDTCIHLADAGQLHTGAGEHAGVHGVNTGTLREYAALCETYRSELIICSGQ